MQSIKNVSILMISRVIGILFLLSFIVPVLNWMFIISHFISSDSNTSLNILNNELLFRLSIIIGLSVSIIILALAFYLYKILSVVNQNMALLAFSLKLVEAYLTATLALANFVALLVLKGDPQNIDLHKIVNPLVENYILFTSIPGIFFGLSMMIYSYLFLKSGYLPVNLAFFGILSYSLVIAYDSLTVLLPDYAALHPIQLTGSAPVCLFQILAGLRLLCKGINMNTTNPTTQSLICQQISLK